MGGQHRSPMRGFSVEFAEHRPYTWGDDLKHIDWKVWARADRFYVKLYEADTNLRAFFLVDSSNSMRYASRSMSKYDYGCTLAAGLAYLLLMQQDAVALKLFDAAVHTELPPSTSPAHLHKLCTLMEQAAPRERTQIASVLHETAERAPPRSMVILVSDLFAPVEEVLSGLRHLRHNRHEVVVWHVVDPAERLFPFDGNIRFEGLEAGEQVRANGRQIRRSYLRAFNEFLATLRTACGQLDVDYTLMDTSEPPDLTLARFLHSRLGRA